MTTALITGATSGLGAEFARQLAASGHDLVLVARDAGRLASRAEETASRYRVRAGVLAADLLTDAGTAAVAERLASEQDPVGVLVNNAGFGLPGWFTANTVQAEKDHLRILVQAPMELAHAALTAMLARGSGRVINVASVAGFTPRGTYSAAKAWVINFSRWANAFYGPQGVPVTAVCPGFVRTEFHQRAGMGTDNIPGWMWLDADKLVAAALTDLARGKSVSIPDPRYKALMGLVKVTPRGLLGGVTSRTGRKYGPR